MNVARELRECVQGKSATRQAPQRGVLLAAMERFQEFTDALPGLLKGDSPNCEAPVEAIQIETCSSDYSDARAFPNDILWLAETVSAAELVRARPQLALGGVEFFFPVQSLC